MIYGLIEWRRVGNWRKCIQDCERADFLNISALKTYDSSQISINMHCWLITVCRYNMSMTVFVTLVIWSCSLYWLENKKLEKNYIERAERASQKFCTFASEKCFTYRPETREKAIINDCEQANFVCVSETCDSFQYFVGESHSLSVQCVLMFVTLVIIVWSCTLVHDDLYRPETCQKLEKNPLMVVSEQSERAEIFALLRQKHISWYYALAYNMKYR